MKDTPSTIEATVLCNSVTNHRTGETVKLSAVAAEKKGPIHKVLISYVDAFESFEPGAEYSVTFKKNDPSKQ